MYNILQYILKILTVYILCLFKHSVRRGWPTWTTCATRSRATRCCCPCTDRRRRRCRAPSRVPSRSPTAGARASAPVPSPGSTRASPTLEYDCATRPVPTSPAPKALVSIIMQEAQIIPYKYANCTAAVLLGRSFPRITHGARVAVWSIWITKGEMCVSDSFFPPSHISLDRNSWLVGASVINPAAHNWNHVMLVKNKFALCCAGLGWMLSQRMHQWETGAGALLLCVCLCARAWCTTSPHQATSRAEIKW